MTLSAGHVGPEKDVQGIGQVVQRHPGIPQQVTRGTRAGNTPLRREHIVHHLVPGTILGNLILQPSLVMAVVGPLDRVLVTEQIGQPIE